jgi:hypothetical protein
LEFPVAALYVGEQGLCRVALYEQIELLHVSFLGELVNVKKPTREIGGTILVGGTICKIR